MHIVILFNQCQWLKYLFSMQLSNYYLNGLCRLHVYNFDVLPLSLASESSSIFATKPSLQVKIFKLMLY